MIYFQSNRYFFAKLAATCCFNYDFLLSIPTHTYRTLFKNFGDKISGSFCPDIVQTPPHPPPFTKGGIDFLKFGNEGGDEIFFLEREGLD